jgi:hypothetical protein
MSELSDSEFDAWLDGVERDEPIPATLPQEDAADLATARRLLALRAVPSPRLKARIARFAAGSSGARTPIGKPLRRRALVGAALAASLALFFTLAFTPAGSWAQGMLQRFGVTFLPGAMPEWTAGPPEITPTRSPVAFSTEREVQAAAEFPLPWPTKFPFARDQVTFLGFMAYTQDGAWVESFYGDEARRYLEVQVFWKRRPGPWPIGDARLEPISVAGRDGLWGEGVPASFIAGARSALIREDLDGTVTRVGNADGSSLEPINVLLWEDGELLYILVDPNREFGLTELLQTAESTYEER